MHAHNKKRVTSKKWLTTLQSACVLEQCMWSKMPQQHCNILLYFIFQTPGESQLPSSMSHERKVITGNDVDRCRASPVVEEYPWESPRRLQTTAHMGLRNRPGRVANRATWPMRCRRFCPISIEVTIDALTPLVEVRQGRFFCSLQQHHLWQVVCALKPYSRLNV